MACLGAVVYDPGTAATKATSALLAMTALDTTNARITFTAPTNGIVLVRIRVAQKGATTNPQLLLGVLESTTVRARQAPIAARQGGSAGLFVLEAVSLVTGLTGGNSYTWDAAYGVEFAVAASTIGWGGPNDTTASNAYGAVTFDIWETAGLLAGVHYDPATAVSKSTAANIAVTALDTTNLRCSFTTPASGAGSAFVAVRLRGMWSGSSATPTGVHFAVLDGATIKLRAAPLGGFTNAGTIAATDHYVGEAMAVIGVSPSTSYDWDAAYAVETAQTGSNLKYGGPNDTTQDNAYGGYGFEVWAA